jgi:large subunit ribosomal protein L6
MSRIGKQPIAIPSGVSVAVKDGDASVVTVKGPKGELSLSCVPEVSVHVEGDQVIVSRKSDERRDRAMHGMTRALLANQMTGVSQGFEKILEIHGTGYAAAVKGKTLELQIGFCHPIVVPIPAGLEVEAQRGKPVLIKIRGVDKQGVGQLAATVRAVRPPDPYKQKGIRYSGEYIIKKEGKAFGKK